MRERLEEQLKNLIDNDDRKLGEKLAQQMEDFQNDLLRNGVTQQTMNNYLNDVEILNRQALPLQQNFQIRVKDYFKMDD